MPGTRSNGPPPAGDGRSNMACPVGRLSTPPIQSVRSEAARALPLRSPSRRWQAFPIDRPRKRDRPSPWGPAKRRWLHCWVLWACTTRWRPQASFAKNAPGNRSTIAVTVAVRSNGGVYPGPGQKIARTIYAPSSGRVPTALHPSGGSNPRACCATRYGMRSSAVCLILAIPPNARTRLAYNTPRLLGYEVVMDVYEGVEEYGIFLAPQGSKAKRCRPRCCLPATAWKPGCKKLPTRVSTANLSAVRCKPYQSGICDLLSAESFLWCLNVFVLIYYLGHPLKLEMFSFVLASTSRC